MRPLQIKPVALALGSFLSISFVLCVAWGLLMPSRLAAMSRFLELVLPGFQWISLGGFLLGLVESFLYGVYIALVFVPLYNYFSTRTGRETLERGAERGWQGRKRSHQP